MRIAIIDLGTNTFSLLIGEATASGPQSLHHERAYVRLGEESLQQGALTQAAQDRALATLRNFRQIIDDYAVTHVHAIGTSVWRSVNNATTLIEKINTHTGIDVTIISGIQEAALIYHGIKNAVPMDETPALMMDIGGGSVEFIIGNAAQILWQHSFEIGAQRLWDKFHQHDPIQPEALVQLATFLDEQLTPLQKAIAQHQPQHLIGASGAFSTLISILHAREEQRFDPDATAYDLPLADFYTLFQSLRHTSRADRLQIPGLKSTRADFPVVSCALIQWVLQHSPITSITYSTYSLRMGVFLKTLGY